MPSNQEALRRYRIIHSILRRGGRHKTKEIVKACKNADVKASLRTIQKDLEDLAQDSKLGFFLPIEKDNKTKTFYYSEIPESLFPALELDPQEIKALLFYANTLTQYREYPVFKEISKAVRKVIDHSNIPPYTKQLFESETLIETEKHGLIEGTQYIIMILEAIYERNVLQIDYIKFGANEAKTYDLKPVLLKEDRQLWYIIGFRQVDNKIITLALDRISRITKKAETFDPIEFDSNNYFQHSFGITVAKGDPVKVLISFNPFQGNYIKALPIHKTQELIEDSAKRFVIQVTVKPSYEFYSKIYSYGKDAIILSPSNIRHQFVEMLKYSLRNYQSIK